MQGLQSPHPAPPRSFWLFANAPNKGGEQAGEGVDYHRLPVRSEPSSKSWGQGPLAELQEEKVQWRIMVHQNTVSCLSLIPRAGMLHTDSAGSGAPWSCLGLCLRNQMWCFCPPPSFFQSASDAAGKGGVPGGLESNTPSPTLSPAARRLLVLCCPPPPHQAREMGH